jgi:hypothetical protein
LIRGDLLSLRSSGGITNVNQCLANDFSGGSVTDNAAPPSAAVYYLGRLVPTGCSLPASYREGLASEKPGAGGNRDVDIAADPDACP